MLKGLDEQIASIYAPIRDGLRQVEDRLRGLAQTERPYLEPLLEYVMTNGGKRIRPAITLLAAGFYDHQPENPITMAAAVELLHVATLVHDDMVDSADLRRGRATASNLWGGRVAVLLGDYLFAASATFVCDTGNVRVVRRFAETIMELSRGELAKVVNEQLTAYIASITGQRVETSDEVRSAALAKILFPFALGACDILSGDVTIFRDCGIFEPHIIAHEFCHRKG